MDTLEPSTGPVEAAGATAAQDTPAQVETQTSAPGTVVSDNTSDSPEGQASQTLLAGKYSSPQELEKAYLEAQKKISEQGQKAAVADLLQEKYGVSPEQLRATIEAQEQQALYEQMQQNPGLYAAERVQRLEQQLALQNEEKELDGFLHKNPEYAPFKDKILNLGLNLERDKTYEEIARDYFGQARATGQQDAYKKIEQKVMQQPTGVTSVPKKQFGLEDMKRMSARELEAILPHSDRIAL